MRKALLSLLLLCGLTSSLFAQQGNTVTVRFAGVPSGTCSAPMFAVNDSNADFYDCKADGTWNKVSGGGGGGTPANPSGSVQFNNAGSFGAVNHLTANVADCDGFADPCVFDYSAAGGFQYIFFGTDTMGTMGNFFDFYYSGGLFIDAGDATVSSNFGVAPGPGATYLQVGGPLGTTGITFETDQRIVAIGRFQFSTSTYQHSVTGSAFAAAAGWGSTAVVDGAGTDNLWRFVVTAGGAGIAANPEFTMTYVDGDFSTGASVVQYVCSQSGGDDILADVTTKTRNQTNEVFIWHGTPTTGKTYEVTCFGAAGN